MKATIKKALFGLVLMIFTCAYAYAAEYEIYDLTPSYSTYSNSYAYDLNENNEVVGHISDSFTSDATYDGKAFLYSAGTWTDLGDEGLYGAEGINEFTQVSGYGIPSGSYDLHGYIYDHTSTTVTDIGNFQSNPTFGYAVANDINDYASVVGYSLTSSYDIHACLYDGSLTDLTTGSSYGNGGIATSANALNNSNQVVGTIFSSDTKAFIWNATDGMTEFTNLTEDYSEAHDINDLGYVVGFAKNTAVSNSHAFISLGGAGTATVLDALPGDAESEAYGINNNNQVVGTSDGKAVMWEEVSPGVWTVTDLNDLLPVTSLWTLVAAYSINDSGSIVGYGRLGTSSDFHAFLLQTEIDQIVVPEPASILLLLGAVIGFVVRKSRNN